MAITLYGIKSCSTMQKARTWLQDHGVVYTFHDYKTAGVELSLLKRWAEQVGWEVLLNRVGTTFRKLSAQDKTELTAARALALMCAQPSMIKRPVLDLDGTLTVGFSAATYARVQWGSQ